MSAEDHGSIDSRAAVDRNRTFGKLGGGEDSPNLHLKGSELPKTVALVKNQAGGTTLEIVPPEKRREYNP